MFNAHVATVKRTLLLNLLLFAASVAQLSAQAAAEPSKRQAKALKVVASVRSIRT